MHEAQIVPDAASLIQPDLTPRQYLWIFVDGVAREGAALQSALRWRKGQHARAQLSLKQARSDFCPALVQGLLHAMRPNCH